MSSVLQQTLRGLCFDTGWCYSVFWKLKRQARLVLTWEDAFYGVKADDMNASSLTITRQGFGQKLNAGLTDMEDPIAFSISKMSYHVYSVGEGIIGRVAFTNKHQWVFSSSDKSTITDGVPAKRASLRTQPEKYPSGWDQQFAAGIKTIAVIAVPQGVVQLGSTGVIAEDLKLIGHVKALFGTLQNVPGAFLSDLVTEVQRGGVHTVYPIAVPAPQLTLATTPSLPATLGRTPSLPENMNLPTAGVGRLPGLLASQPQILTHAHSMPSPSLLGFIGSVPYFQRAPCESPMMESFSHPSFYTLNPSCTWAGAEDIQPVSIGITPKVVVVTPPMPTSITTGTKANASSRTGVIKHTSLNSKASAMAMPATTGTDLSLTGGKGANVEESGLLKANPPRTGVIRHLSISSKTSPIAIPAAKDPAEAVHSPYPINSSARGKGAFDIAIPAATGSNLSVTGGKGVNVEESELLKSNLPPRTGVIKHLALTSKTSPIAIPASMDPPTAVRSPYPVNSSATTGTGVFVEESEKSTANPPHRTDIIKHLSLSSKTSPVSKPGATGTPVPQPVYFQYAAASGGKEFKGLNMEEYEKLRTLSQSKVKIESPGPVKNIYEHVAAEGCDAKSFIQRPECFHSATKESCSSLSGRFFPETTRNMGCGASSATQSLVGVQLSAEQPSSRPSVKGSPQAVHERLSFLEIPQLSSRHSENPLKLDSCRSSFERGQLGQNSVGAGHLNWGRHMVDYMQLATVPIGNQLAISVAQFDSSLPPTEISSHVDRPLTQNGQGISLPTEQLGIPTIPTEVYQLENFTLTSSRLGESKLITCSSTDVSRGLNVCEERSTSCTPRQDSQGKETCSINVEVSLLPVEEMTSESSHLTVQMSDLLELAQQFENADSEGHRDFSSEIVDSHQSLSFGLQSDDYFESLQSLKPLFQSPERPAAIDCSVYNLFTTEQDEFDDFFASLAKAENGKGDFFSLPETLCEIRSNSEVSTYLDIHSCGVSAQGKEKFTNVTAGANASQPFPDWVANEAISLDNEVANRQEDFQVDRFVNSHIYPEVSLPCTRLDGDTDLGCQAMAAMPAPSAIRQHETRKKGRKRSRPAQGDGIQQFKSRHKVQEQIQKLRTIIPDGANCSIDTLLERALEYANALQTVVSQDSGKGTPSSKLQAGGTEMGSGSATTSLDASWVVDIGSEERPCPILVESLSQPGQMLVEMRCQEHSVFLKIADFIKGLGFTITKGIMEARNNSLWAQFVIMGPKDIHRVQVLWPLMQLLGSSTTR